MSQRVVQVRQPLTKSALDLYIDDQYPIPEFTSSSTAVGTQALIKVYYAALNRADIVQRNGMYPPPPGSSPIIGLEVSGVIEKFNNNNNNTAQQEEQTVIEEADGFRVGDLVYCLVEGGGYSEYVIASTSQMFHCSNSSNANNNNVNNSNANNRGDRGGISLKEGAAISEAFLTAFQCFFKIGRLHERLEGNLNVLIHGGASGVGLALVQLCRLSGLCKNICVTCGSDEKGEFCKQFGATHYVNYKENPKWSEKLSALLSDDQQNQGKSGGVNPLIDYILDPIGGNTYLEQDVQIARLDGTIIGIASMGGTSSTIDLSLMLRKRIRIQYSTLRNRSPQYKQQLVQELKDYIKDSFETGKLVANVDRVFDLDQVVQAHEYMEQNKNSGKIILKIRGDLE